jgi:hypothetical protein
MKTQIIRRIVLITIALFFTFNNNGSNMQSVDVYPSSNIFANGILKNPDHNNNNEIKISSMGCTVCVDRQDAPVIPEPGGDNEFHSFHFHHEKRSAFWKTIFNKILEAVYYVVVLLTYMPIKIFR